jgi:hypothetical protein
MLLYSILKILHIYQQMRTTGLQTSYKYYSLLLVLNL